jgi:adenylate cyclase
VAIASAGDQTVDYDSLAPDYRQAQLTRIRSYLARIAKRETILARALPSDDSLTIGEARRFSAAVLFIDVCGFSGRSLEGDQEQDRTFKALALFFAEMARICEDYGGGVEKNTGDGLMAWFRDNDGSPPEKASKRAVAAALTMMEVNGGPLATLYREMQVEPFSIRITIDKGMITVGNMGLPRGFRANVAVGSTANFASKLLKLAKADEIVIGDTVKKELPEGWQAFTVPVTESTGWTYVQTQLPYLAHRYTGRWKR